MYLEWYLKEQAAGEKTLEETVVELLAEKGFHITTAESCTGGMIAGTLVNVAGASEVLNEGYVTYSNEAKESLEQSVNRLHGRWQKGQQGQRKQKLH